MPDVGGTYSENGFHRQRRNLIVGSLILFFIHFADIRLGTQGSLLGLPITIGKPEVVHWFLYAAVLYWALRFYQFHRQRRPTEMQMKAREFMFRFFQRRAIAMLKEPPAFAPPEFAEGRQAELVPFNFHLGPYWRDRIAARITRAWHVDVDGEIQDKREDKEYPIVFRGWLLWRGRVLGYLHASVNTPAFTEYFLPYLFFVVSISYATYRSWPL